MKASGTDTPLKLDTAAALKVRTALARIETGNPRADNLLAMIARLKQREGVSFSMIHNNGPHA